MTWLDRWRKYISSTRCPAVPQTVNTLPTVICRPAQSAAALPCNLKRLRHQRGFTVGELSRAAMDRAGFVSPSTIRAIERGATNPTLSKVLALARGLGVGVEALVEDGS